ncbi:class I adenylate-forming enzyme family protein [Thermoflavimicrobium daqui]|uniref:Long-chain fatty acid--CoA ligase n=1 Tax=Thermoflavimicrobium daqui TaxID=2137476 RepID=A0A364K473_9BACL|nr:class I adenylate-forming enzyme family protein [Thermoflavimicrobium daqui]RAL24188.1 long-chain fatty acid--CoA ligase [Thermoflavimicrobium daqui]
MNTLGNLLQNRANESPTLEAFRSNLFCYTFKTYNERVNQLAHFLLDHHVQKGDRIAILCKNNHPFPTILMATLKIGAIAVPLSWQLTSYELKDILENFQPKIIFYDREFSDSLTSYHPSSYFTVEVGVEDNTTEEYDRIFVQYPSSEPNVNVNEQDIAMILFTSGTTGNVKGCIFKHGPLFSYISKTKTQTTQSNGKRFLASHPFYHMSSITTILITIYNGITLIPLTNPTPAKIWDAIEEHQVTMMLAFPSTYIYMLEEWKAREKQGKNTSLLQIAFSGGTKVPANLILEYKKMGIPMLQGYGSTESWVVTRWHPGMGYDKVESVGKPFDDVQVKIVSPDSGKEVGTGEIGEILVKSPYMFEGYWNNPTATEKILKNGWLHMGDSGKIDEEGFLYVLGRYKDVIVYGGDNIYPDQVEEVIEQIEGILEAAVIGVPDPIFGEKPRAYVVKDKTSTVTEEEIKKYCRERLASYKVPEICLVDTLPKNYLGKVLKRVLKDEAEKDVQK